MKKLTLITLLTFSTLAAAKQTNTAEQILAATGVQGGLIVHLGCGNGTLTAALQQNGPFLVHGLDPDPRKVAKARAHVQDLGVYGPVSIAHHEGNTLPYADNLVNLLISEDHGDIVMEECLRVLAPNGVAYIKTPNGWNKTVKPWPADIDEWTHHLHDAGGNPVGSDRVTGPPHHLQWTAGPLWARNHGYTPSVSAMVSAQGRLFYICDEALTGADETIPGSWFLVARDAFSGVALWKRPVPNWGSVNLSGTPDTGQTITTGRFTMPPHLGKRLVAAGDTVYVTLGATAPVTALDAATGKTKLVFTGTEYADEILCVGNRLLVSLNPPRDIARLVPGGSELPAPPPGKRICAVDTNTGRVLWNRGPFVGVRSSRGQDPFGRLELAADENNLLALTLDAIECLATDSGDTRWKIVRPQMAKESVRKLGFAGMFDYTLTTMVYHDGVVLLAQPEPNTHHTYHTIPGTLYAFDAQNGRQLWKESFGGWGHSTQPDIFVIDGAVWTHVHAETEYGSAWGKGYRALDTGKVDYRIKALDLMTGKLQREISTKDIFDVGHHNRCYRAKITERFLMCSRRGVEFVDLETGENYQNHWVRSGCKLGNLPCNGLLYVAPHPCQCYIDAKLKGFNALAPKNTCVTHPTLKTRRLQKGPAYGTATNAPPHTGDWPTYRGNTRRTGSTGTIVLPLLKSAWRVSIGTQPSALSIANGKVLVAGVDAHTIHAFDAQSGQKTWQYTAGARVDSPPTFHGNAAIFGSADGQVHSLHTSDGKLIWRFDAAPTQRLVTAFGQLESAWPVHGSVTIHQGKCWFTAGRSSHLDGGIRAYALDPVSGSVLFERSLYTPDPETGKSPIETSSTQMAGVLNDILGTDAENVYLRPMNISSDAETTGHYLHSTAGYLDASWFNRSAWTFGPARTSGLMVLGNNTAYGVEVFHGRGANVVFAPGTESYQLKCLPLKRQPTTKNKAKFGRLKPLWEQRIGIRVSALLLAGNTLFAAGALDALEAGTNGLLAAFDARTGEKLAQYTLEAPPVWDGIAAARARLYLSLTNGAVICMNTNTK
jgi:outer membrane protein assembly factor BamB/SAM-dependent methyltransferase